jgi:hypothetical protein
MHSAVAAHVGLKAACPSVVMSMYRLNSGREGSLWLAEADAFDADSWQLTAYFSADGSMGFTRWRCGFGSGACGLDWYKGQLACTLRCTESMEARLVATMCTDQDRYEPHDSSSDKYLVASPSTASTSTTPLLEA